LIHLVLSCVISEKPHCGRSRPKKERRRRCLPEPVGFEHLESISINARERQPIHFHRFRNKRGLTQPDTHGSFCLPVRGRTQTGKLTFPKPISGPLALGFGCHYGLEMFKAG